MKNIVIIVNICVLSLRVPRKSCTFHKDLLVLCTRSCLTILTQAKQIPKIQQIPKTKIQTIYHHHQHPTTHHHPSPTTTHPPPPNTHHPPPLTTRHHHQQPRPSPQSPPTTTTPPPTTTHHTLHYSQTYLQYNSILH